MSTGIISQVTTTTGKTRDTKTYTQTYIQSTKLIMSVRSILCLMLVIKWVSADKVFSTFVPPTGASFVQQLPRLGRQEGSATVGIDFSDCVDDPETGLCCVELEETVSALQSEPVLDCKHKNLERCHYTYVTQFHPVDEEVCEENFEKVCQITFKGEPLEETVNKCYRPLIKTCTGEGPEQCRTEFESSCTTRYIEKQPGKFVGNTTCEKLPIEICGAGCTTEEGPEECFEKQITTLVDVPEEICDLNPQKVCKFETKLVPRLEPKPECTIIPQQFCSLIFGTPAQVDKPLRTRWCLDDSPPQPDELYPEGSQ